MYWYVLFTRTGREEKVEQLLKKRLDNEAFIPFIPKLETIFRSSHKIRKELEPLFPSYVFIESELTSKEIINTTRDIASNSKDIIRFLKYGDTDNIAMREYEKNILMRLYNDDHCIESSSGIIVGSHVYINKGPLTGMESIIRKIDRHKRRAIIELDFMGAVRQISAALEIVEKI